MFGTWARRLLLCVLFFCVLHTPTQAIRPVDFQVAHGLRVEHAGANVWVVHDELPEYVTSGLIYGLYALIARTLDAQELRRCTLWSLMHLQVTARAAMIRRCVRRWGRFSGDMHPI